MNEDRFRQNHRHHHRNEMSDSRSDSLFNLRYSVRVLEREASLWSRIDLCLRFVTVLSGTAVLATMIAWLPPFIAGPAVLLFGLLQVTEVVLHASRRADQAMLASKAYRDILSKQHELSDDALSIAYHKACNEDSVRCFEALRKAAYNDVVREKGMAESAIIQLGKGETLLAAIA